MEKILSDLTKLKNQKLVLEDKAREFLSESLSKNEKEYKIFSDKIKEIIGNLDSIGGEIIGHSKEAMNDSINSNLNKAKGLLDSTQRDLILFSRKIKNARSILEKRSLVPKTHVADFQNLSSDVNLLGKDFSSAKEEFFEAKLLYVYLLNGKILSAAELPLADFETYAGALSDFCGELVRKSRLIIITKEGNKKDIYCHYATMKNIYQILSNFSFSNKSGIRGKVEKLKEFIQKTEDFLYDMNKG